MLAPLGLISALRNSFRNQSRGWWEEFDVSLADQEFVLTENRRGKPPIVARIPWNSVAIVCFVDGGQGSDCFYLLAADNSKLAMVPAEASGGLAFWEELKARNLFPAEISGQAVRSTTQGARLWWPPQHGR